MSTSRRPTGTTRGSVGTRSTTVLRPCGSRAVVTTPGGLVQEDVGERLTLDALTVDLDDVALAHDRVQLADLAVHAHAPVADEIVRTPSRSDSGTREVRVEAHGRIVG